MDIIIKINEIHQLDKVQAVIRKGIIDAPADVVNQINALYANTEMFNKRLSAGMENMFTAWTDDTCVGVISVMKTQVQAGNRIISSILFIYVDPEYRNRKIASMLMNHCLEECKKCNVFKLSMSARFIEKRLICLGINHGFKPEGYIDVADEKYDSVILGIRP